jgi:hypothetical protein
MLAPVILSLMSVTSLLAAAPEPCRLLTPSEVRASLGAAPTEVSPDGPAKDPDLNAMSWSCTQEVSSPSWSSTRPAPRPAAWSR